MGWKGLMAITLGLSVVFVLVGQLLLAHQQHRQHHKHLQHPHHRVQHKVEDGGDGLFQFVLPRLRAGMQRHGSSNQESAVDKGIGDGGRPAQAGVGAEGNTKEEKAAAAALVRANRVRPKKIAREQSLATQVGPWLTIFTILPDVPPLQSRQQSSSSALGHLQNHAKRTLLALLSWIALGVEIVAFGHTSACHAFETAFLQRAYQGLFNCRPILCHKDSVPTLDCPFREVKKRAKAPVIMYSNSDVVYLPSLRPTVQELQRTFANSFFAVGKRIDLTMRATKPFEDTFIEQAVACMQSRQNQCFHLLKVWEEALPGALNHDRNGIDYMLFPRDLRFTVSPFMVGRIQWDQWLLLKLIMDESVTTIEISHVTVGLHMHHGSYKASHSKEGTDYNVNLAQQLPHPRVHAQSHVPIKGTVWLGRLDEVDVLAFAPDTWQLWWEQADVPMRPQQQQGQGMANLGQQQQQKQAGTVGLSSDIINTHPDLLRLPTSYFESEFTPASGKRSSGYMDASPSDKLVFVPNRQSLDVLLFKAHSILHGRRFVLFYVIASTAEVPMALIAACHSDAFNHDILFVTRDPSVWHWLTAIRLHVWHQPPSTSQADTLTAATGAMLHAIHLGYSVALAESATIINGTHPTAISRSDADVLVARTQGGAALVYARSSASTYTLWLRLHGMLKNGAKRRTLLPNSGVSVLQPLLTELKPTAQAMGSNRPVISYVDVDTIRPPDGCGTSQLMRSPKFQDLTDRLYTASAQCALDAAIMREICATLRPAGLCRFVNRFNSNTPHLPHSLFLDQPSFNPDRHLHHSNIVLLCQP